MFYGNPNQLAIQALATITSIVFSFGVTFLLAKLLSVTTGLRVTESQEEAGLDISEHGERAYSDDVIGGALSGAD